VVETLVMLGLAAQRKMAVEKANTLRNASLIKSVSHKSETSFSDGTHFYRFPLQEEMRSESKQLIVRCS
jgi:hypothetical protein